MDTDSNLSDEDYEKIALEDSFDGGGLIADNGSDVLTLTVAQTSPRLRLLQAQILDGDLTVSDAKDDDVYDPSDPSDPSVQSQGFDILSEIPEPLDSEVS